MAGATLTGALAGGTLGCATFNPVGVGVGAGIGGLAAMVAYFANDPEEPESWRTLLSNGIRDSLGGALTVAEVGVLSTGFGARFATIAELEQMARDMELDESDTAIMLGFAGAAVTVGWALAIGGAVGLGAITTRAAKEIINLPGAAAGSPLRVPADDLEDLAKCIFCAFATANIQAIRDTASIAAGHDAGGLGPLAFGQSLAPAEFETSTAMASALFAATGAMVALCLYMKNGGDWKDMPVANRQTLCEFAGGQLREKMHGAVQMASTSPLTTIFKLEMPGPWPLKAVGELLKLATTPAAMFGYYSAYIEHLSKHPAGEDASAAATPAFFGGGILFSGYWIGLLMKWSMSKTPKDLDLVDATDRTPYTDLLRAAIMGVGVLTIALASDRGLGEASPERAVSQESAFAIALMMGFTFQLLSKLGNPQHTLREAREGYAAALSGFATGTLLGGVPQAFAVTGGMLFEQAAGLLYEWSLKQADMKLTTQAAVDAQAVKRAADEAPAREMAARQAKAIEDEAKRLSAQFIANYTGMSPLAVEQQMLNSGQGLYASPEEKNAARQLFNPLIEPLHHSPTRLEGTPRRRGAPSSPAVPQNE